MVIVKHHRDKTGQYATLLMCLQDKMADQNAPQRSVKLEKHQRMWWGIAVASLSGAVGSLFSPGFNVVTNDAFNTLAPGVKPLTVYTG